jgi:hypothetical protein
MRIPTDENSKTCLFYCFLPMKQSFYSYYPLKEKGFVKNLEMWDRDLEQKEGINFERRDTSRVISRCM